MKREQAGLPMRHERITAIVGSTRSLQRLEGGEATGLTYPVIGALCDLYKIPAEEKFELQRLWELREGTTWSQPWGKGPFGYNAYQELELEACEVFRFETTYVPGKLQTERYARRVFSGNPGLDEAGVDRQVDLRLKGQQSFWGGGGGRTYKFLISEAVVRFAGDEEQIDRLIAADALPYATVNYLPFEYGPSPLLNVPFAMLSFADENFPDIVCVEAGNGMIYFEAEESVSYYRYSIAAGEGQYRPIKEITL
ncbi:MULTISPECIES: helix-turn-helix domain-containing protein [Glycomyces]|uniref:Helix-turn-helix transcriptional regulator n=2 Tax=Glycomyces TaxID=58113 RepID=A0A9X3PEF7_9ACTN|nr:helix-turn-helix transcriptional regulator [Glycomyces lechevalierae]MDA1383961.1 helix-turn-helix transcriptional regulator [Glycomyces lechevalierae]MDR7341045.1 hypothetical protein [Glycomyces lechevalierae]